jgi:hypothetical protein
MARERVELRVPEAPVAVEPGRRGSEPCGHEATVLRPPLPPPGDEAGVLEHPEVLRDRRERDGEGRGELRHHRPAARQAGEDRPPRRARERGEDRIQGGGLTLNHVVNRR